MTKLSVLVIFAAGKTFLTPDQVRERIQSHPDRRSFYSYLQRLQKQGLLERSPNRRRGYLSYRITPRGHARIAYLRSHPDS
jgi:DNA-binding PadR family transcriptional regulator